MSDYAKARINMVECQLRTNGITTPDILDSFSTVPREAFLTGDLKKNAYVDDDLPLPGAGFLMEPLVFAHMVEAAAPAPTDTVLNIGDVTGYSSAIFARVVNKVVAWEAKAGALMAAQAQWSALGYGNIVAVGSAAPGAGALQPYHHQRRCGRCAGKSAGATGERRTAGRCRAAAGTESRRCDRYRERRGGDLFPARPE